VAKAPRSPRRIDFRSDTVTQPTDAMRKAMAEAEVGDDLYGEDPTVQRLQERAAKLVGMEAALFVPSGTMGNQIAVWVHTQRQGAVLTDRYSHVAYYEGDGASRLSGVGVKVLDSANGEFGEAEMAPFFLPRDPHFSPVKMVSAEDTHQFFGGRPWDPARLKAAAEAAHRRGAKFHVDGARIFNAAVAQGTTASRLLKGADSVMFCLSKGLSAPVGSLICGSEEFVEEAAFARKLLGGGMRQSGHLAAAGLVALKTGIDRLADDHANAAKLGKGLADLPGCRLAFPVATNMVMLEVAKPLGVKGLVAKAAKAGVLCGARVDDDVVRFVTHRNVATADVQETLERLETALG
jgi:threonine aldolase